MNRGPRYDIVTTRSGSPAVRDRWLGEVMHPGPGPLEEARSLYVEQTDLVGRLADPAGPGERPGQALKEALPPAREGQSPLVLFDVGLGAASNAIAARAAALAAGSAARRLRLISFERDLAPLELALDHASRFGLAGEAGEAARTLIREGRSETGRVTWELRHGDALEMLGRESSRADIVFWDPFSPGATPELWTVRAFELLRRATSDRCFAVTYSGSTAVRSALLLAGFVVGEGWPTGLKSGTTCAATAPGLVARPLDRSFLGRLSRSTAPLPPDAPPDALDRIHACPQFRNR